MPRLAIIATSWKPVIRLGMLFKVPVSSTETHVNNGPYTDGVLRHPGQVSLNSELRL